MRIIAGKYRGSKLNTLDGLKTRPTLDATKEAIFSSLGSYIPGFVVLDIFGGSGALSLESLSRGAEKAYIIDNNIDAIILLLIKNEIISSITFNLNGGSMNTKSNLTCFNFSKIFLYSAW